jgi:hypothetical protein
MTVQLRVTETRFDKIYRVDELEAPTVSVAYGNWLRDFAATDNRFNQSMLSLFQLHSDLRIGGPTWDVHFEFMYHPE